MIEEVTISPRANKPKTSSVGIFALLLLLTLVAVALFFAGWSPRKSRLQLIEAEAKENAEERLPVTVSKVKISAAIRELSLPGNVGAIGETPIYARSEGYIKIRKADIGDVVKKGDMLVVIDSPELDQQLRNARARLEQLKAASAQVRAAIEQTKATAKLAEVNFGRSQQLVAAGIVAKADLDEKTALYDARKADVKAQEANLNAAEEAIKAQGAEIGRLEQLEDFKTVRAPFDGIITQRNCALGNLITPSALAAGRDLYRLSDISKLRIFVNIPQSNIGDIKDGMKAIVKVPDLARTFTGFVSRKSNALENTTRTMLTEVSVVNEKNALLPGMYVQVALETSRENRALLVPGDTIMTRSEGTFVAVVGKDNKIAIRKIQTGRDFGAELEALSGVAEGDQVVVNPSDDVKAGILVRPTARK